MDTPVKTAATPHQNPTALPPAPQGQNDTLDQIKALYREVTELKAKQTAAEQPTAAAAGPVSAPKPIDWTKITEADIANLNIPIPVIEQETPEYLTVHLKDKNYVPRWVHILRERLGPALASGFSYVAQEDLDMNYPHPLLFDANAHYSHGDVVCLKILKERYFGAIRRNYLKTMAIHGRAKTREQLSNSLRDDPLLQEQFQTGSMELYTPEDMKGTTYTNDMFKAV
jgi:hypothetical protein